MRVALTIDGADAPRIVYPAAVTARSANRDTAARFLEKVEPVQGSWWPAFADWLAAHSAAKKVAPPRMGAPQKGLRPLDDAPGRYVLEK